MQKLSNLNEGPIATGSDATVVLTRLKKDIDRVERDYP